MKLFQLTDEQSHLSEPPLIRWFLIAVAFLFLTLFLVIPLAVVFVEALRKGFVLYRSAVTEPYAVAAIKLTLLTAAVSVFANTVFGIALRGVSRNLIFAEEYPDYTDRFTFAVSPVISGICLCCCLG
jgi:sulfate transport system permease protein